MRVNQPLVLNSRPRTKSQEGRRERHREKKHDPSGFHEEPTSGGELLHAVVLRRTPRSNKHDKRLAANGIQHKRLNDQKHNQCRMGEKVECINCSSSHNQRPSIITFTHTKRSGGKGASGVAESTQTAHGAKHTRGDMVGDADAC